MDELMLRRAKKGDADAFEQLLTPLEQMVWRVCWHYTNHTEDARDCAQEAMLKAWRVIGQYRGDCSLESWMYRICQSVCMDFLRGKKRHAAESADALHEEGFEPASCEETPEEAAVSRDRRRALRRAIAQLPEEWRTVLILYAMEKKKYEEIARITGAHVGTVKSRLNRARQKLAQLMAEGEQTPGAKDGKGGRAS